MDFLISAFAFIFILGAAVVLHEFGHFIVAKLLKIRVETFSVGFGPRLLGRQWGTTDYRLSLIPLGGYVKLGGDESNAPIEGEGQSDIPANERFDLRPKFHKFLVAVAGPVMNIITALSVPFIGAMILGMPITPSPVISSVAAGGAADRAGLKEGDRIVAFNGAENPTWERIRGDALLSPDRPLPLSVDRNGQIVNLTITPRKQVENGESIGELDFNPDFGELPAIVGPVEPKSPAEEAGMKTGDRILSINGTRVRNKEQVTQFIQDHKKEPIHLVVARNGQRVELTAQVRRLPDGSERLGFAFGRETSLKQAGPIEALGYAFRTNIEVLRLTGIALGQVITGDRSAQDTLAGPIGIARASAMAAHMWGWEGIFSMLGTLSLHLGIMNLLPIPVLDGGAIFLLIVEAVLGWVGITLSLRMRERIQQFGFVVLILLMGFAITNDLVKEASRWRGTDNQRPAATAPK
jgi:regulator of sigma E protease